MERRTVGVLVAVLLLTLAVATPVLGLFPGFVSPESQRVAEPRLYSNVPAWDYTYHGNLETVFRVGNGTNGVPVTVWNNGEHSQTTRIELVHRLTGTTVLTHTQTLAANESVQLDLLVKSNYRVVVTDLEDDRRFTYSVERSWFDCNDHNVQIRTGAQPGSGSATGHGQTTGGCLVPHTVPAPHWLV
jgi:hypothetical protein